VKVKWPNDIWIAGKKVAGVLVDVDIIGSEVSVSAGVGINVNEDYTQQRDDTLKTSAISISNAIQQQQQSSSSSSPSVVSREALLAFIMNHLEHLLSLPFNALLNAYREWDCVVGHTVVVMPRKREDAASYYEADAVGYSEEGYLIVRRNEAQGGTGKEQQLVAEEVSIRTL